MPDDLAQNCPKPAPFKWTAMKRRAVELLAEDELTDEQVSAAVGTKRRTLNLWKAHPEFAAAVKEAVAALGEVARRYAIGRRAARVRWLDARRADLESRREALRRVIAERAAALAGCDAPGAGTGVLNFDRRIESDGEPVVVLESARVDAPLLRELREVEKELREHERQAATELGQWSEKHEVTGADGKDIFPGLDELMKLPREDLLRLYEERRRAAEGKGP